MKKTIFFLFLFIFAFMPLTSQAATTGLDSRRDVINFLKDGFNAQKSLADRERTKEEINQILDPYFTEKYNEVFWKENIHRIGGKYITYGTDYARYYIPFFSYNYKTRVVIRPNEIYVFEFFPEGREGPVNYRNRYEGVYLIKKNNQWKVDQSLYGQIPQKIILEAMIQRNKDVLLHHR